MLRSAGQGKPCSNNYALLNNHIEFIRTHRGDVIETVAGIDVRSDLPDVACWFPKEEQASIPKHCSSVHLLPWTGNSWPQRLIDSGFQPAESLSYMELIGDISRTARTDEYIDISAVADENGANEFARIQGDAFLEPHDLTADLWRSCFQMMALKNFRRPDQAFYLGKLCGQAVSTGLVVRTADTAGIYAVATIPEGRRQGVSTALLHRVVKDARLSGSSSITLQAISGSYAEGLYMRLGFTSCFHCQVWRAPD